MESLSPRRNNQGRDSPTKLDHLDITHNLNDAASISRKAAFTKQGTNKTRRHSERTLSKNPTSPTRRRTTSAVDAVAVNETGLGMSRPTAPHSANTNMADSPDRPTYTPTTHRISKAKKGRRVHACPHEGCGKVFTRAEHLRRHQYNHNPEPRYTCNIAGCPKTFQRPDLRARHMERHEHQNQKAYQTIIENNSRRFCDSLSTSEADTANSASYTSSHGDYHTLAGTTVSQGPTIMAPSHIGSPTTPSPQGTPGAFRMNTSMLSPVFIPQNYVPDLCYGPDSSSPYSSSASSQSTISPYPRAHFPHEPYRLGSRHDSLSSTHAIDPALCPPARSAVSTHSTYDAWNLVQSPQVLSSPYDSAYYQPVGLPAFVRPLSQERTQSLPASAVSIATLDEHALYQIRGKAVDASAVRLGQDGSIITLQKANQYLEGYWQRFDVSLPIIHRSTFSVSPNMLLTAVMVAIGAQYDDDPQAKLFASSLQQGFKKELAKLKISSTSRISDMQAVLLIEIFSRLRSKRIDVEPSQEFKNLYASLLEAQYGQSGHHYASTSSLDLQSDWLSWIKIESRRRLVLSAFMWDVQQATLFEQDLCIPNLDWSATGFCLPCPKQLWLCDSSYAWSLKRSVIPDTSLPLTDTVKAFINLDPQPQPLDEFASTLVLSGLMSVATIIDREQGDNDRREKRKNLELSYRRWWHSYFTTSEDASSVTTPTSKDPYTLITYHMALLTLHTNIRDLLSVTGETFLFGQKCQEDQFFVAKHGLRSWVQTSDAAHAVWHATNILRMTLRAETRETTLHGHWCMYISSLVCWAYGIAHRPTGAGETADVWEYLDAMNTTAWEELDAVDSKWQTTKLLDHVKSLLIQTTCHERTCELLSEGAQVLRRLIEGRSKFLQF